MPSCISEISLSIVHEFQHCLNELWALKSYRKMQDTSTCLKLIFKRSCLGISTDDNSNNNNFIN